MVLTEYKQFFLAFGPGVDEFVSFPWGQWGEQIRV